jgi:hypothetical protein
MNIRKIAAAAGIAVAVAAGTTACSGFDSGYGYTQPYVVGRTMCPNQYGNVTPCVIMSDGDIVSVNQSVFDSILYGMLLQSYSGGYHWVRPPASYNIHVHNVSVTDYHTYSKTHTSVKAVTPSTEASEESSGDTFNEGGSSYTSSPKYKASVAAAKASSGSSTAKSTYGSSTGGKYSYTPTKTTYTPSKVSYSSNKSSYSSYKSTSYSSSKSRY